jgi:predicted nuclease of predicted toxin-antitoxin system
MRVLVDECVPRRLVRALVGIAATHSPDAGWAGKKNGELLALAEGTFDVLLTTDKNLEHQQSLAGRKLSVIVMRPSNRFEALLPLVPDVLQALAGIGPGAFLRVGAR